MNKLYKVYTHTTPDGMVYVGVTSRDKLYLRWVPSRYKSTSLQPYIEQYGWENIKHEVIYTTPDRDEAYQVEEEMRQYYEEKDCCINKQRSGLIKSKDEKAYLQQWYQDNPEYNRNYRQEHKVELSEYDKQYYETHKEELKAYKHQWYLKKKAEKIA